MFNALLFILLLIVFAVADRLWIRGRSLSMIRQWARDNGYELVTAQLRGLRQGPFFLRSSTGQSVYRIVVRNRAGTIQNGWARCGGSFFGLLRDEIAVELDL